MLLLALPKPARGALNEVIFDFNSGDAGWGHYDPGAALGQVNTRTFPADGSGGTGYRQYGPGTSCANIINRGGAYRSEQYQEFFQSVELSDYDPMMDASSIFVGSRITPPSPSAPGQLSGYTTIYAPGSPRARQGLLANIEFTAEITSNFLDLYRGGAAPVTQIPPGRKTRVVFSGLNDTCKAELYDVTDLLEPLVRINFQDSTANVGAHTTGENLLGWLNLEFEERCDFTWDNYHSTGLRNTPVGFPGTPQVINLIPAAQTLFYTIPTTNQIRFTASTFTTAQIATNTMKLFLNDVDVSAGLAFTEVKDAFGGSPNTNFTVRWNGTLSSNTVYHGKIIVLDPNNKGTTNNWYFDTFRFFDPTDAANPSGFLLVEAEDYDYGGGQHLDYPKVSGTDSTTTSYDPIFDVTCACTPPPQETLGPEVNAGLGYYNLVGMDDIDFHDNTTDGLNSHSRNQYRTMDRVGTVQGTKGGGFDTPRPYRTVGSSYVPDYIVSNVQPGDWMNYTRTFPSGNYNVYLRVSSQGRQDVRLDQVLSGLGTSNQTTALRGEFLVPNTQGLTRFRYIPLTDGAGNLQTLTLSGLNTLRLTANQVRTGVTPTDDPISDLQLNWLLFVPTTAPASSQPFIASASPSANSDNFGPTATASIVILNRTSAVSCPGSIQLRFDGVNVTSAATISCTTAEGPGATVSYRPPGFLVPNSVHTMSLVFSDGTTTQSNQWAFTVEPSIPLLVAGDGLAGSPDTLFTVQVNKAQNGADPTACAVQGPFENWIPRAEQQLAGQLINGDTGQPYPNQAAGTTSGFYTEGNAIQYEQCGGTTPFFGQAKTFPGIPATDPGGDWDCAAGSPDHFAVAATIKLQLGAGVYRMGVNSDDQFKVTAGGATGTNVFLASSVNSLPDTTHDGQFEFVVQNNGIYNLRLLYEEGEGGAFVEWYWVNRTTGTRELVRPLELLSSATVNGPYTLDSTAQIDPGAKTITVPKSGNTHFYRLLSGAAYTLGKPTVSGNNIVLTYQ